ncbi:superinfection immunity protein [Paraburkholderia sp. Ac-20340]|uniref:superinfection immunity protein n=1 Tax=Paraburkholderia sp. Ac-20340 TaxID=2703888 RepID=UPI00197E0440|nr:superinfection immunity protein [Paraburkholderia sp. Ac-20340]MBN3852841.1 superinfection immunity protein [Paraburkholderia sp. Ac-20340]
MEHSKKSIVGAAVWSLVVVVLFCVQVIALGYFAPTAIAKYRKRDGVRLIGFVNVVTGWTGIGWIVCLFWSLCGLAEIY